MSSYCDLVESQNRDGGKVNDETAMNLVYYAHARYNAGNWAKAEDVYWEIFSFRVSTYGPRHAKTIKVVEWLAQNYKKARLFALAAARFQEILAVKQNQNGEDDKRTIATLIQLADTTFSQKTDAKLEEAESHFKRVVRLRTLHEGTESKGVNDAKRMVFGCLVELRKRSEATLLQREILDWYERNHCYGANSTVDQLHAMANMQLFARYYTKALDGLLRVLSLRKVALGKDHMKTLIVVQRVGTAHRCLGQLEEALLY
jgi:hypothetical protein